jgi:hypothetical protein
VEHKALSMKYSKEAFTCVKCPLEWALVTKRLVVTISAIIIVFVFHKSLPKEPWHTKGISIIFNVLCDQGMYAIEECRVHLVASTCLHVVC